MALHHMGSASQCIMCKKKQASSYVDEISLNDGAPVLPLRHVPADMLPPQLPVPQQRHLEQRLHCKLHVVATARSTAKHVGRPSSWERGGGDFFPSILRRAPAPVHCSKSGPSQGLFLQAPKPGQGPKGGPAGSKALEGGHHMPIYLRPSGCPIQFFSAPLASDTYRSRGFGCSSYSSYSRYSSVMV